MPVQLPPDLEARIRSAVRHFWSTRSTQAGKQKQVGKSDQGARSAVTGGAQMDGFIDLFARLIRDAGMPETCIFRSSKLEPRKQVADAAVGLPLLQQARVEWYDRFHQPKTGKSETSEQQSDRRVLWSVVEGYLTRWRIEEAIRSTKQSYNLKDIRVLTYRRLCNLTALVLAASYFAAVHLGDRLRLAVLTRRVPQVARRFYGIASFRYYAIADGISYILRRLGKGPLRPSIPPSNDRQLSFSKFT
jgi:hypothetical protein